jgi:hypothetical protein
LLRFAFGGMVAQNFSACASIRAWRRFCASRTAWKTLVNSVDGSVIVPPSHSQ